VEGELDDISGSGQTEAAHELCPGVPKAQHMHYEAKGAGHYGIFSGRRWRDMVYPVMKAFILAHPFKAPVTERMESAPATVRAKPTPRAATTRKLAPSATAKKSASTGGTPSSPAAKARAAAKRPVKAPVAAKKPTRTQTA
jgi:poly(3-hydroxybutyrate) depolymerase